MKSYKGYSIESGTVKNKNGFNVAPDANGYYSLPPNERLTIEQLQAKIEGYKQGYERSDTVIKGIAITQANGEIKTVMAKEPIVYDSHNVTPKEKKVKVLRNVIQKNAKQKGAAKGHNNINSDGWYIIAGNRYESVKAAHDATGLRPNTLAQYCKMGCSFEPK